MKTYKPLYGMSFVMLFADLLVCLIPSLAVICAFYGDSPTKVLDTTGTVLAAFLVILGAFTLALNLVARPFSKKEVLLDDSYLQYDGKNLPLHNVLSLTLHLGFFSKHRHEPNQLAVWSGDDATHTVILRPSLPLILRLRRLCPHANFRIEGWVKYAVLPLVGFVIITFALFFGMEF